METLKLCGTLVMKTMKKNAREHNINKVMQELTATELLLTTNSHSKKKMKNVKDCFKNELNKIRKSKRFVSRSRFFSVNVESQLPNQWFRG